jgi:hypothetical protein
MRQWSQLTHSRNQWQYTATLRGEGERYPRTQHARLKAQDHRTSHALKETQARLRQLAAQLHGLAPVPNVAVVH